MKRTLIFLITLYQHTLSPDHGFGRVLAPYAGCRFQPTCSMYAKDAINHYGVWQGILLSIKRIGRCHPFTRGGYDPIPKEAHHG
ncbi:MAG: membrane protein insertion efficiency factor YidD [Patescibacteria group bacterium]|jgi:hypothetical protein